MAEDDSGVERGGVSGEFKVSSRELQASKAQRDCLDNADNTLKKLKIPNTFIKRSLRVLCQKNYKNEPRHINKLTPVSITRRDWECSFHPPSFLKKRTTERKRMYVML